MDEFEKAMADEFDALLAIVKERRDGLIRQFSPTTKAMGKMFALGAADSALWRLARRAKGEAGPDGV